MSWALPFPALVSPRGTTPVPSSNSLNLITAAPEPWIHSALSASSSAWGSWWGHGPVQCHTGFFQMTPLRGSPLVPASLLCVMARPTPCSHTIKPSLVFLKCLGLAAMDIPGAAIPSLAPA